MAALFFKLSLNLYIRFYPGVIWEDFVVDFLPDSLGPPSSPVFLTNLLENRAFRSTIPATAVFGLGISKVLAAGLPSDDTDIDLFLLPILSLI